MIDFLSGSVPPAAPVVTSAENPIEDVIVVAVPEPGTIFLFVVGLCGLIALRWRAQGGGLFLIVRGTRAKSVA